MTNWIARIVLYAGGVVTGWFIAKDAPNFGVMQMAIGLLVLAIIVAILAFWPAQWGLKRHRARQERAPGPSS